jgi:hypothetical protein
MGHLSYLVTKKGCASLDLNLDFLKSLGPGDDKMKIKTILIRPGVTCFLLLKHIMKGMIF